MIDAYPHPVCRRSASPASAPSRRRERAAARARRAGRRLSRAPSRGGSCRCRRSARASACPAPSISAPSVDGRHLPAQIHARRRGRSGSTSTRAPAAIVGRAIVARTRRRGAGRRGAAIPDSRDETICRRRLDAAARRSEGECDAGPDRRGRTQSGPPAARDARRRRLCGRSRHRRRGRPLSRLDRKL